MRERGLKIWNKVSREGKGVSGRKTKVFEIGWSYG